MDKIIQEFNIERCRIQFSWRCLKQRNDDTPNAKGSLSGLSYSFNVSGVHTHCNLPIGFHFIAADFLLKFSTHSYP